MSTPLPTLIRLTGPGKVVVWINPSAVGFVNPAPGGGTMINMGANYGVQVSEPVDDVVRAINRQLCP